MKKIFVLLMVIAPFFTFANNYSLNLSDVDQTISQAQEVNYQNFNLNHEISVSPLVTNEQAGVKNATTALVLSVFVGYLGVHRLYLGTTMTTFILYLITGGGCGILATVDDVLLLIALIQSDPIDAYVDNPHLFMWQN